MYLSASCTSHDGIAQTGRLPGLANAQQDQLVYVPVYRTPQKNSCALNTLENEIWIVEAIRIIKTGMRRTKVFG